MKIEIKIDDQGVLAAFNRLLAAGGGLKPIWVDIGEHLVRTTQQRFDSGTDPQGRPWQLLARGTYEGIASRKSSLTKTGRLSARGAVRVRFIPARAGNVPLATTL